MPKRPFLSEVEAPSLLGILPAVDHSDLPVLGRSGGWDLPVNQVKSMNEIDTDTLDLMISVRAAINAGKLVEYKNNLRFKGLPTEWTLVEASHKWNFEAFDYRIKPLEFPKLPEGMEWHNPLELSADQVGDGYRLLLTCEIDGRFSGAEVEYWDYLPGKWKDAPMAKFSDNCYRVPASTPFPEPPKPKVMVRLGPYDFPPGSVVRLKGSSDYHWISVQSVHLFGVSVPSKICDALNLTPSYEGLREYCDVKRPGQDWQPCEKESES